MPRLKTTCTHPTKLGIQNALNHTTTNETTTNLSEKKLKDYRFHVNEKARFRDGNDAIEPEEIINAIRGEGGTIVKSVKGKVAHDVIVVIDTKDSENVGSTFVSVKDLLDFLLSDDKEATFEVKVIRDDANKENEKALANKSFCCTGRFQTLGTNRKNAKAALHRYVQKNGATVSVHVTRQTEFLIVDQFGGASYVKAARKVGARIVTIENVVQYAETKDEKFLESDEKLADEILGKDEKKKVASLKRKVNASNLDDDLAADDDDDEDDDDDDDDNDDDYNDEEDDDEEEDDDYNDDDSNAFENTDAMDEDNDDEFDDNDDLAAAAAEERRGMEKLGMKFQRTNLSSKKLSSNRRSSKTPAKKAEETPRRSSRATKPTTTILAKLPKAGEEQSCAGGDNCPNNGIIKKGETRYLANDTKGVFCGPIENRIVDSNNLVRYLCGRCARPETTCTRCGKILPAGDHHRAEDKVNGGGWKCLEGYCQNDAGKEAAKKKWPEAPCARCGKILPAGDHHRAADKVNGGGGWRCPEGYCQNDAGKEAAKKKWPEAPCTRCGKILPAGDHHRAADREKEGRRWRCPKDRGCGGKK